jgi:hypothetical protein
MTIPQTALYLLEKLSKEAICRAHDGIFGGHNDTIKAYLKLIFLLLAKMTARH